MTQPDLRQRLADALYSTYGQFDHHRTYALADAVLAVVQPELDLPAVVSPPADRDAEEAAKHVVRSIFALKTPSPDGSKHYQSGWDDGLEAAMDAARDAVLAVLPEQVDRAAEIERLRQEHATWRKLGKHNLEQAFEENARLHAEHAAMLERIREAVRRLAAHAVGFRDVLEDTDCGSWGRTIAADIEELRRLAGEAQQDEEREAAEYARALATPPSAETAAFIRDRLAGRAREAQQAPASGTCGRPSPSGQHRCEQPVGHHGYHRRTLHDGDEWASWTPDLPATVARSGQPETDEETPFGHPGCTCKPWITEEDGKRRFLEPGETVDRICGWHVNASCPHHAPSC
ncbi:hypothetical protein [Streptomyces sp. NPDC017086]|uniref:hypothetical protein n=1 Tax=Streptomyces sp. NPDC017086 TaxID=3364976 RepID=UPI0037B8E51A